MNLIAVLLSLVAFASPDKEAVRSAVKEHHKEIQSCYQEALAKKSDLKGKVVVDWTVNDVGVVTQASINETQTSLKDLTVQTCITDKFKTWTFPAAPAGTVIKVSYPFMFSKEPLAK